jgi:hypothetical protein
MLRVRASLRSDGRYGGGYDGAFEGFIRPSNGNVSIAAAFLYGNDAFGAEKGRVDVAEPEGGLLRDASGRFEYDGVLHTGEQLHDGETVNLLDGRAEAESDTGAGGEGENIPEPE